MASTTIILGIVLVILAVMTVLYVIESKQNRARLNKRIKAERKLLKTVEESHLKLKGLLKTYNDDEIA